MMEAISTFRACILDAVSGLLQLVNEAPAATTITLMISIFVAAILTRVLTGSLYLKGDIQDGKRSVPTVPYWLPILGHTFQFMYDPGTLMTYARNESHHGIFALKLGPSRYNVISDPGLAKEVFQQRESALSFQPIQWYVTHNFFGIPRRLKDVYLESWESLNNCTTNALTKEPYLGDMLKVFTRGLEYYIPQMISFMDNEIDQQPWERISDCRIVSSHPPAVEINLMTLIRNMLGAAAVPALMGQAFTDNFPDILREVNMLDSAMKWLIIGIPAWFPIPTATRGHIARSRLFQSLKEFNQAYDDVLTGMEPSSKWGDMADVSELIKSRNTIYREAGIGPGDRAEHILLWALSVNTDSTIFWQMLNILATPGLSERLRVETEPFVRFLKSESINGISEPPNINISHEGLSKYCPLLRATFFETLRTCNQPWSVRQAAREVQLSGGNYFLRKGDYVTVPHELHMLDPSYYDEPTKFKPERLLVTGEDGKLFLNLGTIRPFGGGHSICKGRILAEKECLSMVAGLLACWNFEPTEPAGFIYPRQVKASAVSKPSRDIRVRVSRRKVD